MMVDVVIERRYPHPLEKVWHALTDSEALAEWLMHNDFEAIEGRSCVFHFCAEDSSHSQPVYVTVEKIDAPRYMRWQWQNAGEAQPSTVTFELEEDGEGTLLTLRHAGEISPELADRLRNGWPSRLDALASVVS